MSTILQHPPTMAIGRRQDMPHSQLEKMAQRILRNSSFTVNAGLEVLRTPAQRQRSTLSRQQRRVQLRRCSTTAVEAHEGQISCRPMTRPPISQTETKTWESLLDLTNEQAFRRKREWNRGPIVDLFPRVPEEPLERILDICIAKDFTYNLSESKLYSARRLTHIVIDHVRHKHSDYDRLLREEDVERYEARRLTREAVWKVLRRWCPWDSSNEVLEKCFEVTLLRPEDRAGWDPMDLDLSNDEHEYEGVVSGDWATWGAAVIENDPMELD